MTRPQTEDVLLDHSGPGGVAELFNQTLKEQVFRGRIFFKNLAEVRVAVAEFKERYNRHWRIEKWASCHPLKSVRLILNKWRPELLKRVQLIGGGTNLPFFTFLTTVFRIKVFCT